MQADKLYYRDDPYEPDPEDIEYVEIEFRRGWVIACPKDWILTDSDEVKWQ